MNAGTDVRHQNESRDSGSVVLDWNEDEEEDEDDDFWSYRPTSFDNTE